MNSTNPTAAIAIIGNEILSGRTLDKNTQFLASQLTAIGIRVAEVRVVRDVEAEIIACVDALSARYTYVFSTGGIGPTHDDITAESLANWAGLPYKLHPNAHKILQLHYAEDLNEARLKMAYMPEGVELIANPVSAAPGFKLRNVYVMAGIPSVMQAMFSSIQHELKGGAPMIAHTISARVTEGMIATDLAAIQKKFPEVEIGSYPFIRSGVIGVSIVLRGLDREHITKAGAEVEKLLGAHGPLLLEEIA